MLHYFKLFLKATSVVQKFLLYIAIMIGITTIFVHFAFGSGSSSPKVNFSAAKEAHRAEIYKNINDPHWNQNDSTKAMLAIYKVSICSAIGEACSNVPSDGDKNVSKSFLGKLTNLIALPYGNMPASGIAWAGNGLANAGLASKAYAQGIGFVGLSPISPLWSAFRDIAYLVLVLAMITIGFLIMFRVKIDAQTVISIESALPRIVITMITITFSFAIAGFLIDMMYLIMGVIINVIGSQINDFNNQSFFDDGLKNIGQTIYDTGPSRLWDSVFVQSDLFSIGYSLITMIPVEVQAILNTVVGIAGALLAGIFFKWIAEALKGIPLMGWLLAGIVGVGISYMGFTIFNVLLGAIITIAVYITLFILFFRIIFMLFGVYTKILLWIIFAPLYLLQDVIPGRNAFMDWIRTLFVHLLTFPIVFGLIMISALISSIAMNDPVRTESLWTPPFLFNRDATGFIRIIGAVILVGIPELTRTAKQALGVKSENLGVGVGSLFGGVTGIATGAFGGYKGIKSLVNPNKPLVESSKLGKLGKIPGLEWLVKKFE